jgi:hypothetical protein
MAEGIFKVTVELFKDGQEGNALLIDMRRIRDQFAYVGIWYAGDKSETTFVTTEIYYASGGDGRPEDFSEEIKENSFKQANRFRLPPGHDRIWIAPRIDGGARCRVKANPFQKENIYINYKVIRTRSQGFEVEGSGTIRGGPANFCRLDIADAGGMGAVMYLVLIRDYPPGDWGVDDQCIGVQKLPILVQACKFSVDRSYSEWNKQSPLDNAGR